MKVDKDGVLVNVGQKTEGVVPSREMRTLTPADVEELKEGDDDGVAFL
jgi:ribosomal protein S1